MGADSDFLGQQTVNYSATNAEDVLNKTVANLKTIFEKFKPQVDSTSKITSPLQVGGTATNPAIKVSFQKCISFVCETVELNALIGLQQMRGPCSKNFVVVADLNASGKILKDQYDKLVFGICFNSTGQKAQIVMKANAMRAFSYAPGIVQGEVFKILQLQIPAIAKAINETLKLNGAGTDKLIPRIR